MEPAFRGTGSTGTSVSGTGTPAPLAGGSGPGPVFGPPGSKADAASGTATDAGGMSATVFAVTAVSAGDAAGWTGLRVAIPPSRCGDVSTTVRRTGAASGMASGLAGKVGSAATVAGSATGALLVTGCVGTDGGALCCHAFASARGGGTCAAGAVAGGVSGALLAPPPRSGATGLPGRATAVTAGVARRWPDGGGEAVSRCGPDCGGSGLSGVAGTRFAAIGAAGRVAGASRAISGWVSAGWGSAAATGGEAATSGPIVAGWARSSPATGGRSASPDIAFAGVKGRSAEALSPVAERSAVTAVSVPDD